jgi:hypothetical protein
LKNFLTRTITHPALAVIGVLAGGVVEFIALQRTRRGRQLNLRNSH